MHFGSSRAEADSELREIFERARVAAGKQDGRGDPSWTVASIMGDEIRFLEGRFAHAADFELKVDPKDRSKITITWTPSDPDLKDPRKRVLTGDLRTGERELEHVDP